MAALSLPYDSTGDYPISTCRYDGETNQYKYTSFQRGSTRNKSPLETHSTSSISRPSPYQPKPLAQSSRPRPKFSSQLSNAHSHPQILTARLPTVKLEDKMSQSPLSPYGGAGRGHYQPPPAHPCRCDRCTGAGSGTGAGLVLYNGATPYCHCCPPYSGQISVVQHGPTNLPPERYNTLESPWKPRKQRDHSLNIPPEKMEPLQRRMEKLERSFDKYVEQRGKDALRRAKVDAKGVPIDDSREASGTQGYGGQKSADRTQGSSKSSSTSSSVSAIRK